jgi:hypothetical protein
MLSATGPAELVPGDSDAHEQGLRDLASNSVHRQGLDSGGPETDRALVVEGGQLAYVGPAHALSPADAVKVNF